MALVLRGVGSGVGSFRSFRFHKERCTLVHLLLHTHFYQDKKNRRTQYHLSRNRAVLLVVCSVLNCTDARPTETCVAPVDASRDLFIYLFSERVV